MFAQLPTTFLCVQVLEYCDAWLKRIEADDGIIPDNVGPTGVVGERRGGQWWGGFCECLLGRPAPLPCFV